MLNLLLTDLKRFLKDKTFYIGLVILALYGFINVRNYVCFQGICERIDGSSLLIGVPIAVILFGIFFISFFLGSDYEEGTIRNKIIIGKKRRDIYLSNLLISFLVITLYFGVYYLAIRWSLHYYEGRIELDKIIFRYLLFDGYLATLAFASLFVFVSMLFRSKAGSLLANLISYGFLMFGSMVAWASFWDSKLLQSKEIRLMLEMVPSMQLSLLLNDYETIVNYKIMGLGSLLFIILINSLGMLLFEVKDLK